MLRQPQSRAAVYEHRILQHHDAGHREIILLQLPLAVRIT
jgi:hypothetical protein